MNLLSNNTILFESFEPVPFSHVHSSCDEDAVVTSGVLREVAKNRDSPGYIGQVKTVDEKYGVERSGFVLPDFGDDSKSTYTYYMLYP